MRIAITGGTGFVGHHLACALAREGHEVVLLSRGVDQRNPEAQERPRVHRVAASVTDLESLRAAFDGCQAVAHCAGINREIARQTYQAVHVEGTRRVVQAAEDRGVERLAIVSFLRARPNCGSAYHESKFAAEEIVRASQLQWTVLRAGMMYGRGDHMLDHLSHAFHTQPFLPTVGLKEQRARPMAIDDAVRILQAALVEGRLDRQTVAAVGPEEMPLVEALRRVSRVVGKPMWTLPLPIALHHAAAWIFERTMKIPLVSHAQVRILSEGVVDPALPVDPLPEDLVPTTGFTDAQIRNGLPEPARFTLRDLSCCHEEAR